MMRGRWVVALLVVAALVAGCGSSESSSPLATDGVPLGPGVPVPPTVTTPTASEPGSGSPDLPATTEPAALPSEGTTPPVLLVVDVDGVWFWWSAERRELVIDGMVGAALPDRVGGIVFQDVETGAWRADDTDPGVAQWRWVGDGSAQPIERLRAPGAVPEIVVEAPADGDVQPIDVAIVGGHPTLAYLRTRYFTIASSGENPWWDSARAELVVRDLTDGSERVLRTQSVGWEYSGRSPSLGEALAAEVIDAYGDLDSWVELLDFDGAPIEPAWDLPRCGCHMAADLPPTGSTLVAAMSGTDNAGQATDTIEVVALDLEDGSEQMRTTFSTPDDTRPVSADSVDRDILVLTATPIADSVQPVISRGDRGPWVQAAQLALSTDDTYLVPDGIFGPRTEAAVEAAQAASGLDPTGTVDAATWELLGWPVFMRNDPILISADGSHRSLPIAPAGTTTPLTRASPTITLWSGPVTPGPAATEPATTLDTPSTPGPPDPPAPFVLRADGFADVDFGDPAEALLDELETAYGPPTTEIIETAEPPGAFTYLPLGYWAAYELRIVEWDPPGLGLVLSDIPFRDGDFAEPVPGTLTLVSWMSSADDLRTDTGIGLGTTLAELRARYPELTVGMWDLACESEYRPTRFVTTTWDGDTPPGWLDLRGWIGWDWVSDLQAALNQQGADLAVDGTYGPATQVAVTNFQLTNPTDFQDTNPPGGILDGGHGGVGPDTMNALGLIPPDDAPVTALDAGYRGSC